jgi:hypothetical protein
MFSSFFSSLVFWGMSSSFAQEPQPPTEAAAVSTTGTKGAWADEMKDEFIKSCNSEKPPSISAAVMNQICTCSLSRLEVLYAPTELGTPEANKQAEQIGASCAMGSKGAWSDLIKNQFMTGCEGSKPEGITAAAMKNICSCSMSMIETKYAPEELQTPEASSFSEKAGEVCAQQELK